MQTKLESIIESILNTISAYIISVMTYYYLIPLFTDYSPTFKESNIVVILFTIISIFRNYFWRRFFNKRVSLKLESDNGYNTNPKTK